MQPIPPRFRTDLVRSRQETPAGAVHIIKDPVSSAFFRFGEAEGFITEQLDGLTPSEEICARAEKQFGASLSEEDLTAFVKSLDKNGLLETRRSTAARKPPGRIIGGLLYARIRLFNPVKFFDFLIRHTEFFFTRRFVWLSAFVIAAAGALTLYDWNDIAADAGELYGFKTLPLLIATIFCTGSAHEISHGLTCRHYGGEVRDMGFMLLYFQPALYCNVSDAWLFPEKSKRLWVGFAGPYFELFLGAVATLLWRATAEGVWVNKLALMVMGASGFKTLINFNPLIKLDGYYLLSDYLEIPNLRRRSFAWVGTLLKRAAGVIPRLPRIPHRERRVYTVYGVSALCASVLFFTYGAFAIVAYLIQNGQRVALLMFVTLAMLRYRMYIARMFGRRSGSSSTKRPTPAKSTPPAALHYLKSIAGMFSRRAGRSNASNNPGGSNSSSSSSSSDSSGSPSNSSNPNGSNNSASPDEGRKSRFRLRLPKRLGRKLGALTAALLIAVFGRMDLRVAGEINVLPYHNNDVRTQVDGTVAQVYVHEGQHLKKGDLVARLDDRDLRNQLAQTQASIAQKQAELAQLIAGPTRDEIQVARRTVADAQDQLVYAKAKLARTEALFKRALVAQAAYDTDKDAETTAADNLADAQSKLRVLLDGTRPEVIAAAKAELQGLQAQRDFLQGELQDVNVVSPSDGVVTTPTRELDGLINQAIPKGGLIAKVYDVKVITLETEVPESQIADVQVGQPVEVKTLAYPDLVFTGRVVEIGTTTDASPSVSLSAPPPSAADSSASSTAKKTGSTIRVITEIDNRDGLLKPGMTGMAKIDCGPRRIIDLITRSFSHTVRVDLWSWW